MAEPCSKIQIAGACGVPARGVFTLWQVGPGGPGVSESEFRTDPAGYALGSSIPNVGRRYLLALLSH
ncbi:hypothetical protein GCM10017687_38180 [Streptomyces echinatus]